MEDRKSRKTRELQEGTTACALLYVVRRTHLVTVTAPPGITASSSYLLQLPPSSYSTNLGNFLLSFFFATTLPPQSTELRILLRFHRTPPLPACDSQTSNQPPASPPCLSGWSHRPHRHRRGFASRAKTSLPVTSPAAAPVRWLPSLPRRSNPQDAARLVLLLLPSCTPVAVSRRFSQARARTEAPERVALSPLRS